MSLVALGFITAVYIVKDFEQVAVHTVSCC